MAVEVASQIRRQKRSVEEKRRIVEETLEAGASVACVARRHAVNANQVFLLAQEVSRRAAW
jgi:transposase